MNLSIYLYLYIWSQPIKLCSIKLQKVAIVAIVWQKKSWQANKYAVHVAKLSAKNGCLHIFDWTVQHLSSPFPTVQMALIICSDA